MDIALKDKMNHLPLGDMSQRANLDRTDQQQILGAAPFYGVSGAKLLCLWIWYRDHVQQPVAQIRRRGNCHNNASI